MWIGLGIGGFFGVRPLGWAGAEPAASGQRQDLAGEAGLCWAGSWRHDSSPGQLSRTPQRGPDDSSSAAAGTGAGGLGPPPPPPRTTSPHLGCPGGRAVWGAHASGIQGTPAQAATARKRNVPSMIYWRYRGSGTNQYHYRRSRRLVTISALRLCAPLLPEHSAAHYSTAPARQRNHRCMEHAWLIIRQVLSPPGLPRPTGP